MIQTVFDVLPGLTLRACRTDRFKSGLLSVSCVCPIDRVHSPLTSLLLSVLRRGTERYPTLGDINRALDTLYGTELSIRNFYRGDVQIFGFSAELLDGSYLPGGEDLTPAVLELICQMLFCPLRDADGMLCRRYVESEKQLQAEAIRARKNEPRAYASERSRAVLYENEPCGAPIYGTEEQISAVTAEQLTAHYEELLASLSLSCFYVGQTDPALIGNALKQAFGGCRLTAASPAIPRPTVRRAACVRRAEDELPVTQGQLILSFRTDAAIGEDDFYACTLANDVLGQSPVSKLFVHVRERLSLCYSCSSSFNAYKGTLTVRCGIDPRRRALAEDEILRQIKALQAGDITDAELVTTKRALTNAYRQLYDNPAAIENYHFCRALANCTVSPEEAIERLCALTREEVMQAARKWTLDTVYFLNATRAQEDDGDEA